MVRTRQLQRALAAGEASADDGDLRSWLGAVQVELVDGDHAGVLGNGEGQLDGLGAHGDDERVGLELVAQRSGHGCLEPDVDAGLASQMRIGASQLVHVVLEGERRLGAQDATELVARLAERHVMAA